MKWKAPHVKEGSYSKKAGTGGRQWKKGKRAGIICPCIYAIRSFLFTALGTEGRWWKKHKRGRKRWEVTPQPREVFWCGVTVVGGPPLPLPHLTQAVLRGLFPYQRAPPLRKYDCGARSASVLSVNLNESSFYAGESFSSSLCNRWIFNTSDRQLWFFFDGSIFTHTYLKL